MSSSLYILSPGQGAQHVGMGKDFAAGSSVAKAAFDEANAVLGFDLAAYCFDGPEERLNQTDISQPAIFATSVACHRAAVVGGVIDPHVATVFAGLSLGEYTALHLAGVFDFETGLRLVSARGKYMQAAAVATPSGMVAVIGANEEQVTALCAEAGQGEVLVPANFNAPGQIVVSGSRAACERFNTAASIAGFRAIPLAVAGAFHSPLMQPAADRMADELTRVKFDVTNAGQVFSNVTAARHGDEATVKKLLVEQIIRPVRWEQTIAQVANEAGAKFIELAPGKVLTGLLKKQNRRAEILTLNTAEALGV